MSRPTHREVQDQAQPALRQTPPRIRLLLRAVHILLECILVHTATATAFFFVLLPLSAMQRKEMGIMESSDGIHTVPVSFLVLSVAVMVHGQVLLGKSLIKDTSIC